MMYTSRDVEVEMEMALESKLDSCKVHSTHDSECHTSDKRRRNGGEDEFVCVPYLHAPLLLYI